MKKQIIENIAIGMGFILMCYTAWELFVKFVEYVGENY